MHGPLADDRGLFAALLHVAWLMGRPTAAHIVQLHRVDLPEVTVAAERAAVRAALDRDVRKGADVRQVRLTVARLVDRSAR